LRPEAAGSSWGRTILFTCLTRMDMRFRLLIRSSVSDSRMELIWGQKSFARYSCIIRWRMFDRSGALETNNSWATSRIENDLADPLSLLGGIASFRRTRTKRLQGT